MRAPATTNKHHSSLPLRHWLTMVDESGLSQRLIRKPCAPKTNPNWALRHHLARCSKATQQTKAEIDSRVATTTVHRDAGARTHPKKAHLATSNHLDTNKRLGRRQEAVWRCHVISSSETPKFLMFASSWSFHVGKLWGYPHVTWALSLRDWLTTNHLLSNFLQACEKNQKEYALTPSRAKHSSTILNQLTTNYDMFFFNLSWIHASSVRLPFRFNLGHLCCMGLPPHVQPLSQSYGLSQKWKNMKT